MKDSRIIAVVGPRQAGKTTLVKRLARKEEHTYITLDETDSRAFARSDPDGFLRSLGNAVIDEVQQAPDLILSLKQKSTTIQRLVDSLSRDTWTYSDEHTHQTRSLAA